eukprot:1750578-Amphidinium_carterae.1
MGCALGLVSVCRSSWKATDVSFRAMVESSGSRSMWGSFFRTSTGRPDVLCAWCKVQSDLSEKRHVLCLLNGFRFGGACNNIHEAYDCFDFRWSKLIDCSRRQS